MVNAHDKRKRSRQQIQVIVEYNGKRNSRFDFCSDLSEGGVFIETTVPLNVGTEIVLTLKLSLQKQDLILKGVVRWSTREARSRNISEGMGVEFFDLTSEQSELIRAAVQSFQDTRKNYFK